MKTSSFLRFGFIVVIFVLVQGFLLAKLFIAPRVFYSSTAYLEGMTVDVRAPVFGMLETVAIQEGEIVQEGQLMFVISRSFVDPQTQRWTNETMPIYTQQEGLVTSVSTVRGTFVQPEQKLARIINNSAESLYVGARFAVAPKDVRYLRQNSSATVRGDFLYNGAPVDALISFIDPQYDPQTGTIGVHLKLLRYPDDIETLPLGIPVTVSVRQDRRTNDNPVIAIFHWAFPFAFSKDSQ